MNKMAFLGALLLTLPVAAADYTTAVTYYDRQMYGQAFDEFKPLADAGDSRSQYYLAYMYLNGYGVPQSDVQGLAYLEKAVADDYAKAESLLAYLYASGTIVEENKPLAVELYEKAAAQGDDDALLNLGIMYYLGNGVENDRAKSLELLQKVNKTRRPVVGRYLGNLYQYSTDENIRKKSKDMYTYAAYNGDMPSMHALGFVEQSGLLADKNPAEAVKYYTYAASQGYAPSQYILATLYANGEGVSRDMYKAHAWMVMSENRGFENAADGRRQLEKNMTLSDLDKAKRALIELERDVMGKVESPITVADAKGVLQEVVSDAVAASSVAGGGVAVGAQTPADIEISHRRSRRR